MKREMKGRPPRRARRVATGTVPAVLALAALGATSATAGAADLQSLFGVESKTEAPAAPPPPVPIGVFGDNLPDPGRLTLTVIPQFGENAHNRVGTRTVTSQQVATMLPGWYWNPAVHYTTLQQWSFVEAQTVTLAYGVMKDLSLVVLTGAWEKHQSLLTFYGSSNLVPRGMSFTGTDGLLDSQAALIWRAYQDPVNRVKINLGMSFPTGSNHNLTGVVLQTPGNFTIPRAFYGMQSGSNTYDLLPGILYGGAIRPWSWGLSYRARIPLTWNPEGYKWGNYQETNGWIGYTWFAGLTTSLRLSFSVQSQIAGADWLIASKLPSANPLSWGGKILQVLGGADIDGKLLGAPGFSVGLEAGVPLYQNLNGPQLSRVWQAGMALRWKVGEEEKEEKISKTGVFKGPAPASTSGRAPWDGVHVGLNVGFTWLADTATHFTYLGSPGSPGFVSLYAQGGLPAGIDLNNQGIIAGAQLGYDRRLSERYVAGLEADLAGLGVGNSSKASWQGSPLTYLQAGRNQHYLGTVRGRLGYLATPDILVYATGGAAIGECDLNATYFAPTLPTPLYLGGSWLGYVDMRLGWTAGAGVEWMVSPRWTLKAEYLYYDLGTANTANAEPLYYVTSKPATWSSVGYKGDFSGNVIRVGVNYHLNGAAPEPLLDK